MKAFNHKEADKVPIGEIDINSSIASKILKKDIYIGWDARIFIEKKSDLLSCGRWQEYAIKNAQGIIEICNKLGFDFFRVNPNPGINEVKPQRISSNMWRYEDKNLGVWEDVMVNKDSNTWCISNDFFKESGLSGFKKYLKEIKKIGPEKCRFGLSTGFSLVSGEIDNSEFVTQNIIKNDDKGKELFIVGNSRIPFPSYYSWMPKFMEWLIDEPVSIKEYCDFYSEVSLLYIKKQIENGILGIIDANDFCYNSGPMISPKMFKEFIFPYIKKYVDFCHNKGVIFIKHIDGNIKPIEKELLLCTGIDGYHGIEPNAGMDIFDIKRKYGKRVTLIGNIDCSAELVNGTKKDILKKVKWLLKNISPGGGHILSSSNAIHSGVSVDNFLYYLKIADEFRNYPINFE